MAVGAVADQGVVDFKLARVAGAHRIEGAVVYQAKPFNVGPAVAEGLAAKGQAGSVALRRTSESYRQREASVAWS